MTFKTQTELIKGCGKNLGFLKCGLIAHNTNHLCPSCQSLLNQTNEIIKLIDEQIVEIKKLRLNITNKDLLRPTVENLNKYHVFEVTGLELIRKEIIGE